MDFLEQSDAQGLQQAIFRSVQDHYRLENSGVIYDVTNTYLYGKHCEMGKLGRDKEGVRPLIQIGLGVTQEEGIPVFHKTFDGNIADARTLQDLITTFRRYDLKSGTLIYDRGITSGKNLADMRALKWNTICGVPLSRPVQNFWRPLLHKQAFRHRLVDASHGSQWPSGIRLAATPGSARCCLSTSPGALRPQRAQTTGCSQRSLD
jgi:hypothetical protein